MPELSPVQRRGEDFRTRCIHEGTNFLQHTNSARSTTVIFTVTTQITAGKKNRLQCILSCFVDLRLKFRPHQTCQRVNEEPL